MNKVKKIQLIVICIIFIMILAAYLGFKYYMNHLPEDNGEADKNITVTNIDTSLVTEIGIINGEESLNLQKEGETWKCLDDASFTVDTETLQTFLNAAGSITAQLMIEDVTDMSQYGLENPGINITLQWDSNLYIIKIGDQNSLAGGCYYLNLNDENIVYTIDSSQYYVLNKTKEDFNLSE